MKINVKKTKVTKVINNEKLTIMAREGKIQQIETFRYLESTLTEDDWRGANWKLT